jgi:ankyrin repeat protein
LVVGLMILTGCTETNGANNMNIKDFYTDPQMLSLIKAAEKNDMDKLNQLVKDGADPNTFGKEYMTPLFWALGHQNKNAMKALLAIGANPNLRDLNGESPMAMASGAEDTEFMKILLECGGDPNIKNHLGNPV